MMRSLAACILFGSAWQGDAVRAQSISLAEESSRDDCVAELRPLVKSITYRELFRPVLAATYYIYEKNTGLYLSERSYDVQGAIKDSQALWQLTILSAEGTPKYLLKNTESNKYLVANYGAGGIAETSFSDRLVAAHWQLHLNSDGQTFSIRNRARNDRLSLEGNDVKLRSWMTADSTWVLEESGNRAGAFWFKESEYRRQWNNNAKLRSIYPGADLKWGAICPGKECEGAYVAERARYVRFSKITETNRNVVTQNTVNGVCDMPLGALKTFARHPEVVGSLRDAVTDSCPKSSLEGFADPLREAIEQECFTDCVQAITEVFPQNCSTNMDYTAVNEQLQTDARCTGVPTDSAEGLKEFVTAGRCFDFHAPSPLWVPKDKSPGDLAAFDGAGTCSGDSKATIQLNGMCPEGSKCKCPRTYMRSRDLAEGIREEAKMSLWTTYSDLDANSSLAINFEKTSPFFSFFGGLMKWQCQQTVGCWPQRPEERSVEGSTRACRMPAKAEHGGSPLWFLPPPMLRLKHSWGKCVLDACDKDHIETQQVGLGASAKLDKYPGKVNVYNCQPLRFEEMTSEQKQKFVTALRETGIFNEYPEPQLN